MKLPVIKIDVDTRSIDIAIEKAKMLQRITTKNSANNSKNIAIEVLAEIAQDTCKSADSRIEACKLLLKSSNSMMLFKTY